MEGKKKVKGRRLKTEGRTKRLKDEYRALNKLGMERFILGPRLRGDDGRRKKEVNIKRSTSNVE